MAGSARWPFHTVGFGGFDLDGSGRPRQKHVRRCDPADASQAPSYDPKQAYASVYLQAGLGHAGAAFIGDVIAQRVEGRWGTRIRDPLKQERELLKVLVGGEWADKWAAWRERGVAERRRRRREEKQRRAQELSGDSDDEGGTPVKPPLADVSKGREKPCLADVTKGWETPRLADVSESRAGEGETVVKPHLADVNESVAGDGSVETGGKLQGGPGEQGAEGRAGKSEGVLSFVHTAFKGVLSLSPFGGNQGASGGTANRARPAGPSQVLRRGPCHDPDAPPGYSLLRSLRMASFAFFVNHPLTNVWTRAIGYNPRNDPTEVTAVKLALTEAVLTPARIVLLFAWDSLLQRKPRRIIRKLRTDFRPAVVRNLQVAAFENVAYYALYKEIGLPEEVVYAVVGLPVSLYYNYFQSTITAR